MKITKSIAGYFDNHKVDELYFCTNGTAFKKENDAIANQKALDKGQTPRDTAKITRAEVEQWRNESGETEQGAEGESGETEQGAVVDTPEVALGKAQVALEEAMKGGNEEAIAAAKKVVSTAKARVTREAKRNAE